MSWFETLLTAIDSVRVHRLRSSLTVLGITIGIAAVVLTVGLGQGAQNKVTSEINALGTNLLTVSPGSSTSSGGVRGGFGSATTLSEADATALSSKTVAPDVKAVAPTATEPESLVAGSNTWTATVVGTTAQWESVRGRSVTQGRFIDDQDVADHAAVAVLGPTTAYELFKDQDPVGQSVEVDGIPFTVVGVLNAVGSTTATGSNQDDQVIVPITTATERIFGTASLSSILVQATSSATLTNAYQETDDELLALHGISTPADADFTITSAKTLDTAATKVDETLTILLGGIAAISLLVGGIGVMNIMLVSVTERIREIGLRKALGATPRLIRRQFLLEASILGLSGGTLGAGVGLLGAAFLPRAIGNPITVSPLAMLGALGIAIAIGLIFGVYPATRAARLAPIDALRSE
jgi:putative ABC transport system permease protein